MRDPTDPLSAVAFGTFEFVEDVVVGITQGTIELGRQVVLPVHKQLQKKQSGAKLDLSHDINHDLYSHSPVFKKADNSPTLNRQDQKPYDIARVIHSQTRLYPSFRRAIPGDSKSQKNAGYVVKRVAIVSGEGVGKMVRAAVKSPVSISHGITRGFHNMPKMYGEEVREYENVTDLRSGMAVGIRCFRYGMLDGLRDVFMKPAEGAYQEGALGLAKGFGKGVGNLICKPSAAVMGLVGYPFLGVYKEVRGLDFGFKDKAVEAVMELGEAEMAQLGTEELREVVNRWCQHLMTGEHSNVVKRRWTNGDIPDYASS